MLRRGGTLSGRFTVGLAPGAAVLALAAALATGPGAAGASSVAGVAVTAGVISPIDSGQSNNWAGYGQGFLEKKALVQSVSGEWIVPTATFHAGGPASQNSATWVGIGGGCIEPSCTLTDPTTLIQAGTEQDANADGTTSYSAWWEIVPVPSTPVPSVKVNPGDLVRVTIAQTLPLVWRIQLTDVTDGQGFTQTVPYPSTMLTAEWITEAPVVVTTGGSSPLGAGIAALPDLSTVQMDNATVNGASAGLVPGDSIQLVASNGTVMATPSAPDADADGFDVCSYASSCPPPTTELP